MAFNILSITLYVMYV